MLNQVGTITPHHMIIDMDCANRWCNVVYKRHFLINMFQNVSKDEKCLRSFVLSNQQLKDQRHSIYNNAVKAVNVCFVYKG